MARAGPRARIAMKSMLAFEDAEGCHIECEHRSGQGGSRLTDATPRTAPGAPSFSSHCAGARTNAPAVNVARSSVASSSNPPRRHNTK
jgi:hypothetical protein